MHTLATSQVSPAVKCLLVPLSAINTFEPHSNLRMLCCSPSTVIDATRTGNDARYMAHSLNPNCQCQRWVVDNQPRGFMVALRDIAPGEELTYNSHMQCSLGQNVRSAVPT